MSDARSSVNLTHKDVLFVTGRLAEPGLREVVEQLAPQLEFTFHIAVPGVQVAALLHINLLLRRLEVVDTVDLIMLPGWVQGDIRELEDRFQRPVIRGPRDYRDLPKFLGVGQRKAADLSRYSIEIIGEINHATLQPIDDIVAEARSLAEAGADVIDVGGVPGDSSPRVKEIVTALRDSGRRVSIDSFDRSEVQQAVEAGAELILSCNHSNLDWVSDFNTEVVAIPDSPADVDSLDRLIEVLGRRGTPFRVDPIIEPIGMGFTQSLQRYMDVRQRYPDVPIMMGVGNITEMTEVDSAGVNMLLAAICEELNIRSVLTTQVINWCRTAVAELDTARRIVHHAVSHQTVPKHIDSSLVMLRDARLRSQSETSLNNLAAALTDTNFRIFAEASGLHLMNRDGHWSGTNPFDVFARALAGTSAPDAGHAFYLGYEMARAEILRHLGKEYQQDEPITFGITGTLPGSAAVHHAAGNEPPPPTDTPQR